MAVRFRLATAADLPRIVAIYNESIPGRLATADVTPVSVAAKRDWFAAFTPDRRPIWVIEVAGTVAGWVSLESFYGRPAYYQTAEISLYIANAFHHQGLGQQALDWVFAHLNGLGLKTVVAYIFSHNQPSQGLFRKNGFMVWGHLPDVAVLDGHLRSLDILGRRFRP